MLHAVVVLALARAGIVQLPIRAAEAAGVAAGLVRAFGATALIADGPLPGTDLPPLRPDPAWLDGGADPPSPAADAPDELRFRRQGHQGQVCGHDPRHG